MAMLTETPDLSAFMHMNGQSESESHFLQKFVSFNVVKNQGMQAKFPQE
jgi:hypothetical protein